MEKGKVSWAHSVRDITITAINKGQLLLYGILLIILFIISKMSPEAVEKLVFNIGKNLANFSFIPYIVCVLLIIIWYYTCKNMRSMHKAECDRIGREKTKLQEKLKKRKGV